MDQAQKSFTDLSHSIPLRAAAECSHIGRSTQFRFSSVAGPSRSLPSGFKNPARVLVWVLGLVCFLQRTSSDALRANGPGVNISPILKREDGTSEALPFRGYLRHLGDATPSPSRPPSFRFIPPPLALTVSPFTSAAEPPHTPPTSTTTAPARARRWGVSGRSAAAPPCPSGHAPGAVPGQARMRPARSHSNPPAKGT